MRGFRDHDITSVRTELFGCDSLVATWLVKPQTNNENYNELLVAFLSLAQLAVMAGVRITPRLVLATRRGAAQTKTTTGMVGNR